MSLNGLSMFSVIRYLSSLARCSIRRKGSLSAHAASKLKAVQLSRSNPSHDLRAGRHQGKLFIWWDEPRLQVQRPSASEMWMPLHDPKPDFSGHVETTTVNIFGKLHTCSELGVNGCKNLNQFASALNKNKCRMHALL